MSRSPAYWDLEELSQTSIDDLRPATAFSLHGKAAIVTGAGGGIGSWLAAGLAAAGANVLLTDVSEEALNPVQDLLVQAGAANTVSATADLQSPDTPDRLVGG